jgi:putative ABC transport system permease protein
MESASTSSSLVTLDLLNLVAAYALILVSMALTRLKGIGQERSLLISSLRMAVQLLLVGYVLEMVFAVQSPLLVVVILFIMVSLALQVSGSRMKERMPGFYRTVGSSLLIGCGVVTCYFTMIVVGQHPWYNPQYLIPLAGMIIGNAMNGASLAAERLASEIRDRQIELETALCLGANAQQAAAPALRSAFRASMIPTINSMAATGIVALPGMMTGQILSGTSPVLAVRYQIAIMCAITAAVTITSLLVLVQGYRNYFTASQQLRRIGNAG